MYGDETHTCEGENKTNTEKRFIALTGNKDSYHCTVAEVGGLGRPVHYENITVARQTSAL